MKVPLVDWRSRTFTPANVGVKAQWWRDTVGSVSWRALPRSVPTVSSVASDSAVAAGVGALGDADPKRAHADLVSPDLAGRRRRLVAA